MSVLAYVSTHIYIYIYICIYAVQTSKIGIMETGKRRGRPGGDNRVPGGEGADDVIGSVIWKSVISWLVGVLNFDFRIIDLATSSGAAVASRAHARPRAGAPTRPPRGVQDHHRVLRRGAEVLLLLNVSKCIVFSCCFLFIYNCLCYIYIYIYTHIHMYIRHMCIIYIYIYTHVYVYMYISL